MNKIKDIKGLPINFGKSNDVEDLPKTVEELAKELNVTEMTIRNTAKKLGIYDSKSTFSDIKMPNGGVRTVKKLSFTKADSDMISATLSVHHNLKDNSVVMNNTIEQIKESQVTDYLNDLCSDNPYIMIAITQQKQLKDQQRQIEEVRNIAMAALNRPQVISNFPTSQYKENENTAIKYVYKRIGRYISTSELPEKKMFSKMWTDENGQYLSNFMAYSLDDLNKICTN